MIIGGGNDILVSEKATRKMADRYGVEPLLIPGAPHNLMMEDGWQLVAEKIEAYLDQGV